MPKNHVLLPLGGFRSGQLWRSALGMQGRSHIVIFPGCTRFAGSAVTLGLAGEAEVLAQVFG